MSKRFLISKVIVVGLFFTTYCFAGIIEDWKELKDIEKIKKENEALKQENANLKQQLANIKKTSYQNIAQTKYKATVSILDNYLIDGDKNEVKVSPLCYELDFNYSRVIDKIIIYFTATPAPLNIDLSFHYYDVINQKWNVLRTINNEGKTTITLTFNPLSTSKLKIYPTINNPNPPLNLPISEVEVFGWVIEE